MPLTDTAIKRTKPADKPIKLTDGDGLYMLINPTGGKWWRFDYRFDGKRKTLSMGVYPTVTLKAVREKLTVTRKLLDQGIDPSVHRKIQHAAKHELVANGFENVAREWFAKFSPDWAKGHADKIIRRLERDIFPWVGQYDIAELKAHQMLNVIRKIEERGAIDTAHRAMQNCSQVFRYGVATGRCERDPTPDLRGAIPPAKGAHYASIIDPVAIGGLLRAIDSYKGFYIVRAALKLAPLTFVRPGELRQAEWAEIDLDAAEWNIPASKMKMREPHLVPLSKQSIEILRDIYALTGAGRYVFPSARTSERPMSDAAVSAALRSMGFARDEMSGHGFRAMARTVLDEVLKVRPDLIEHQLAHAVKDPLGRAYNRTKHLDERKVMMQQWGDYLDSLKSSSLSDFPLPAGISNLVKINTNELIIMV